MKDLRDGRFEGMFRRRRHLALAMVLGLVPGLLGTWILYPVLDPYTGIYSEIDWALRGGYFVLAALMSLFVSQVTGRGSGRDSGPSVPDDPVLHRQAILLGMGAGDLAGYVGVGVFFLTGSPRDLILGIMAAGLFFVQYFPRRLPPEWTRPGKQTPRP